MDGCAENTDFSHNIDSNSKDFILSFFIFFVIEFFLLNLVFIYCVCENLELIYFKLFLYGYRDIKKNISI
jgi:hypothetical protein